MMWAVALQLLQKMENTNKGFLKLEVFRRLLLAPQKHEPGWRLAVRNLESRSAVTSFIPAGTKGL